MNTRRGFLASLLGTGAAMALDPERALWLPGKKLISIPKPQVRLITDEDIRLYIMPVVEAMGRDLETLLYRPYDCVEE